jgi:tetratricopeptide (TPR) repeat protein
MLISLVVSLAAQAPAPDEHFLVLRDGRVFQDRPLERVEGGVQVVFPSGKVFVADELVHLALIGGEDDIQPATDEERAKVEKGLVPFEGEWIPRKRRDELLQKRIAAQKAEVADNLAHREWKDRRIEETKNFHFEHTVPRHVFEGYRERMEAYYQVFAKDWKIKPPRQGKLNVCFYSNEKEYYRTSGAPYGAIAYFYFGGKYDLNVYYDPLDAIGTEQTMYHEASHYLQRLIDERFHYPHWPGEALAEYYGASQWDPEKKKLTVGLIQEGRLAEVQDDIARGDWMTLKRLLLGEGSYEHYTWGWSLVHFLMNDSRYQGPFKKFFFGLATGQDVRRTAVWDQTTVEPADLEEAFYEYMGLDGSKEIAAFEREWHDYVQELLTKLSTRGLEKAAEKAFSTDRKLRAKRLCQEAIDAGSRDPLLHHRYARLLEKEDRPRAIELWRKAIELSPLTGTFWLALGRALEDQDKAESERLKKLAHEIDPELDEDSFQWEF